MVFFGLWVWVGVGLWGLLEVVWWRVVVRGRVVEEEGWSEGGRFSGRMAAR